MAEAKLRKQSLGAFEAGFQKQKRKQNLMKNGRKIENKTEKSSVTHWWHEQMGECHVSVLFETVLRHQVPSTNTTLPHGS